MDIFKEWESIINREDSVTSIRISMAGKKMALYSNSLYLISPTNSIGSVSRII